MISCESAINNGDSVSGDGAEMELSKLDLINYAGTRRPTPTCGCTATTTSASPKPSTAENTNCASASTIWTVSAFGVHCRAGT